MARYLLILKSPSVRFDAVKKKTSSGKKPNCTGKGTEPCGNVCRKPENCKKTTGTASQKRKTKASGGSAGIDLEALQKKHSENVQKLKDRIAAEKKKRVAEKVEAKQPKAESKRSKSKSKSKEPAKKEPLGEIKTYEEGRKTLVDTIREIDKKGNYDGLVPIYQVRRALGDKFSRSQFNDYMIELQVDDVASLQGGAIEDGEPSKLRDSVSTRVTGLRAFIQLEDSDRVNEAMSRPVSKAQEKELRESSEKRYEVENNTKIKDEKSFDKVAGAVFDRVNFEHNLDNLVPIGQLREEMKGKVSEKDFDKYVRNLQEKGFELIGGGRNAPSGGIKTSVGDRDFISRKGRETSLWSS